MPSGELHERRDQVERRLLAAQAAHRADDERSGWDADPAPRGCAIERHVPVGLDLDPRADELILLRPADAHRQPVPAVGFRHHDDGLGESGTEALEMNPRRARPRRVLASEYQAMVSVHDHRGAGEPGGEPADDPGLRGVRVHHVVPSAADPSGETQHRQGVEHRVRAPHQCGFHLERHPARAALRVQRALRPGLGAAHDPAREPRAVDERAGEQGVLLRSAHDHPGDDVENAGRSARRAQTAHAAAAAMCRRGPASAGDSWKERPRPRVPGLWRRSITTVRRLTWAGRPVRGDPLAPASPTRARADPAPPCR